MLEVTNGKVYLNPDKAKPSVRGERIFLIKRRAI
jgi:hypothetical protein